MAGSITAAEISQVSAKPAGGEFPAQSIQDDEPAGPIERQASWAGGSWAGIAGTRVDSSSRRTGCSPRDSRRHRGWVLADWSRPAHVDAGGGLDWTRRSGSSRHGRRRLLDDRQARVHRGSRGTLDRSGPDAVAAVRKCWWWCRRWRDRPARSRSSSRHVPRAAPLCQSWPTMVPSMHRASRGRAAREDRVSPARGHARARARLSHDGARRGRRDLEQLHGRARRAQGGRARGPDLRRAEDVDNVSSGLIQDLIVTFDDRIHPLMARRCGNSARRRWRRSLHDLVIELARSPGRRPVPGRRICQSGRPRPGLPIPVRQPVRHDVFECGAEAGPSRPHGHGSRIHACGCVQSEVVEGASGGRQIDWTRRVGWTKRSPTSPRTSTGFRRPTSTIASVRS